MPYVGEKPFKCDICSAPFPRTDDRILHTLSHTGKEPLRFDMCSASFPKADD